MKRREFIAHRGPRRGVCLADEVIDRGGGVESEFGTSRRFATMQRFVGYRGQGGLGQSVRSAH